MATEHNEGIRNRSWLTPVAVTIGLVIFAGTFFVYASRHSEQFPVGYMPAGLGASIFLVAMSVINYIALPGGPGVSHLSKALAIAALEAIVFIFLLVFLLVNTFGS